MHTNSIERDLFVTVKTFTYPHEISIIKARLEAEGIECFVKDELTTGIHPFYSNAIGGVKLQVKQKHADDALALLRDAGYVEPEQSHDSTSKFLSKLDESTGRIPIIKTMQLEVRLFVLIFGSAILFIAIFWLFLNPSSPEKAFLNTRWCMKSITYHGEYFEPYSSGLRISGPGFCNEEIEFATDGTVRIPGFNSYKFQGRWELISSDRLMIFQADTFRNVFEGTYSIQIDGNQLILQSPATTIYSDGTGSY